MVDARLGLVYTIHVLLAHSEADHYVIHFMPVEKAQVDVLVPTKSRVETLFQKLKFVRVFIFFFCGTNKFSP